MRGWNQKISLENHSLLSVVCAKLEPRWQRFYFLPFITATLKGKGGNSGSAGDLLRDCESRECLQWNRLSDRDCLDGRRVDSSFAQVAKTLLY